MQHVLGALNEVHLHRGGQLTKFGNVLREVLLKLHAPSSQRFDHEQDALAVSIFADSDVSESGDGTIANLHAPNFEVHDCNVQPAGVGAFDSQVLVEGGVPDSDFSAAARPESHCFFCPTDVCSFAAGSHSAWMAVRVFITMVRFGRSFDQAWAFGKQFKPSNVIPDQDALDPSGSHFIQINDDCSLEAIYSSDEAEPDEDVLENLHDKCEVFAADVQPPPRGAENAHSHTECDVFVSGSTNLSQEFDLDSLQNDSIAGVEADGSRIPAEYETDSETGLYGVKSSKACILCDDVSDPASSNSSQAFVPMAHHTPGLHQHREFFTASNLWDQGHAPSKSGSGENLGSGTAYDAKGGVDIPAAPSRSNVEGLAQHLQSLGDLSALNVGIDGCGTLQDELRSISCSSKPHSHCFFSSADVRNYGAASKFALVTVKPFFIMINRGLTFSQSVRVVLLEDPPKQAAPNDDGGGVKHDCKQQ